MQTFHEEIQEHLARLDDLRALNGRIVNNLIRAKDLALQRGHVEGVPSVSSIEECLDSVYANQDDINEIYETSLGMIKATSPDYVSSGKVKKRGKKIHLKITRAATAAADVFDMTQEILQEYSVSHALANSEDVNAISNSSDHLSQPHGATWLLHILLPQKDRINLIGCLEEEYQNVLEKHGKRKASCFMWSQVLASLWPYIKALPAWSLIKKVLGVGIAKQVWDWIYQWFQHLKL